MSVITAEVYSEYVIPEERNAVFRETRMLLYKLFQYGILDRKVNQLAHRLYEKSNRKIIQWFYW